MPASNQRVLITGSSRGIGAEIARAFAMQTADTVLHGRDREALNSVVDDLRSIADGRVEGHLADLTDPHQAQRLADAVGAIDVLIVNAGGAARGFGPLEDVDIDEFRAIVEANLFSAFYTLRAFLPGLKERGSAAVVLISSGSAHIAHERNPIAYAAAKAGIESLTKNLAVQAGPFGVRVNCIAPETILTETNRRQLPKDIQDDLAKQHPLRRLGLPADVAALAVFLASDEAAWITGTVIDVAGGAITR
jgi:3-oxoacyl-[acyl-carrier protein] reductase